MKTILIAFTHYIYAHRKFLLEFGVLESRTLIKVGPGLYKMVIKNKAGKTGGYDMKFTELGISLTAHVGSLTATAFYR